MKGQEETGAVESDSVAQLAVDTFRLFDEIHVFKRIFLSEIDFNRTRCVRHVLIASSSPSSFLRYSYLVEVSNGSNESRTRFYAD